MKYQLVKDRQSVMDILLLADESKEIITGYLNRGELYAFYEDDNIAGAGLFTFPHKKVVEIKNIALIEEFRGRGLGKEAIQWAVDHFKELGYSQMIVGTSNSSIENIYFYQRAGFRFHEIKRDFFASYVEPFHENGIRGLDMVVFERDLR